MLRFWHRHLATTISIGGPSWQTTSYRSFLTPEQAFSLDTFLVSIKVLGMSTAKPETIFREHPDPGYPGRTEWNAANSDVTIDFAELSHGRIVGSGGSSGLTRLMAERHHRPYVGVPIVPDRLEAVAAAHTIMTGLPLTPAGLRVNIAGHGLARMRGLSQTTINAYVIETLRLVTAELALRDQSITLVMSGGQTGFDEAGIIAGRTLGLATMVTAPHGWRFRDADGHDIADHAAFVRRFETSEGD
jgi:hypothetical protein